MILVIDNYDSFTWNLVQFLGELGVESNVLRNDCVTVDDIRAMAPERIVISPGPCTPEEAGVSIAAIQCLSGTVPVLGVCLGHQAIAAAYGGRVTRADRLMHGKTSLVAHRGIGIFEGIPSPLTVARYHSLVVDPGTLPAALEVVAWTHESGYEHEIQAVRHREHPVWGVQFHPESIASECGKELLRNFLAIA